MYIPWSKISSASKQRSIIHSMVAAGN